MKWTGSGNSEDLSGYGQFEEGGPEIRFDKFEDYFYIQRLFDIRKGLHHNQGRRDVLNAVRNYVEGMK
jgi:hypothetical protein